jgi:hypothetical protein
MAEQIHSRDTGNNHKKQTKSEQTPVRGLLSEGLGLVLLSTGLFDNRLSPGETSSNRSASQLNKLQDGRLLTVQRQALASSIGERQGNRHLSRALLIQRGPENEGGGEE